MTARLRERKIMRAWHESLNKSDNFVVSINPSFSFRIALVGQYRANQSGQIHQAVLTPP